MYDATERRRSRGFTSRRRNRMIIVAVVALSSILAIWAGFGLTANVTPDPPPTLPHTADSLPSSTSYDTLAVFSDRSLVRRRGSVFTTACETDPVVVSSKSAGKKFTPLQLANLRYKACYAGSSGKSSGRFVETLPKKGDGNKISYRSSSSSGSKFLYFGNKWGRHSNQLTSLVGALALSRALGRTLIIPPFAIEKAKGGKGNQNAASIEAFDLYNLEDLFDVTKSPYCVITEDEFYALELERNDKKHALLLKQHKRELQDQDGSVLAVGHPLYIPAPSPKKKDSQGVGDGADGDEEGVSKPRALDIVVVPSTCVNMRGIKFPQQPRRINFQCTKDTTVFIKYKKDLALFFRTLLPMESSTTTTSSPRVITVPLVIYYTPKIPLPCILCVWKYLKPHPLVHMALDTLWRELGDGGGGAQDYNGGGDGNATMPSVTATGVHLRALEGSCQSRIDEGEKAFKRQQSEQAADSTEKKSTDIGKDGQPLVHGVRMFPLPPDEADTTKILPLWHAAGYFGYVGDGWGETSDSSERKTAWRNALTAQCTIEEETIRSLSGSDSYVFLADDGQQPQYVNKLARLFPKSRRMGELLQNPRSEFQKLVMAITKSASDELPLVVRDAAVTSPLDKAHTDVTAAPNAALIPVENPATVVRNRFRIAASTFLTQLDFWLLARCDVFIGNQLSTLSLNVCRQRLSVGRKCDNFAAIQY